MSDTSRHWLPARAALHPTGLYLAMRQIALPELQDAFMIETVERVAAAEEFVHVPKHDLGRVARSTAPAGMIFHIGRGGSTLITQMLKAQGGVAVYSEPLSVNEILVPPQPWPRAELVGALRSLGAAFAAHAGKPYVLKFSSWNTLYCDLLTEAFPETPWVFNWRDPLEVAVSNMREMPGWFRANQEASRQLARVVDPQGVTQTGEAYTARAYGALCEAVARLDFARGKLVSYDALPVAVWEAIAPHFGLTVDAAAQGRMAKVAGTYSKARVGQATQFVADATTKRAAASDALKAAVETYARPALTRLLAR